MRILKMLLFLLFTLLMTRAAFLSPQPAPAAATPAPVVIVPAPTATPAPVVIITPAPAPQPTPGPGFLLPDSSSRYLTEADLSGLTHEQLCFARNEIFARHGRIFKTPEIAAYFNSKSWYRGTVSPENFDENVLNKYEWANVSFIREYENKYYGGSYY